MNTESPAFLIVCSVLLTVLAILTCKIDPSDCTASVFVLVLAATIAVEAVERIYFNIKKRRAHKKALHRHIQNLKHKNMIDKKD